MRILHLPSSIGSNSYNLAIGEKMNGAESRVLIQNPTMYSNKADIVLLPSKNKYINFAKYIKFCILNRSKYDVFHYNFGSALFNTHNRTLFGLDLRLFKRRKKVIAVTYQGSDARQANYCVKHYETSHYTKEDAIDQKAIDEEKIFRISFFEKNADLIYATNPDLLNMLPERAKFRPYTKLQPEEWKPFFSDYTKKRISILHAPSNPKVKGTEYVNKAIKQLQDEGYEIEYMLLQNIPNSEVIEYYKKADLVIDQLLVGWYGGFAVECMALGKPVMCYIRESDLKYIPQRMREDMPIIKVTKETLYQQLKEMLDHKQDLAEIARKSRAYVEEWHDPEKIAKDILADYQRVYNRKTGK